MEINKKSKRTLVLQSWSFTILFLVIAGMLGWLSTRYNKDFDWTATGRHTLTEASAKVLEKLEAPLTITSYASGADQGPVRTRVREALKRYQKHSDKINLIFVDPMTSPEKIRELGIRSDGEMIFEYQNRTEHVQEFSESAITNTLQRLLRNAERQIVFITGHGERESTGQANHDVSLFMEGLKNKGFIVRDINLTQALVIPPNTAVVVLASPIVEYLDGEIDVLKNYIEQGGHLLWIQEPDSRAKLKPLADLLGIEFTGGVIVDMDIQLLGVNDPTIIMGQYGQHAITDNFNVLTLFPRTVGITYKESEKWQVTPFLKSIDRSWLEKGKLEGTIRFDAGVDTQGPINVGLALSREIKPREIKAPESDKKDPATTHNQTQRIVILGDGDFISNAYLGNQGNQSMGENIFNWLSHDDNFIDIPQAKAPDAEMVVTETGMIMFGLLYFIIIPLMLIGAGVFIWLKRRKR
jgi:ABC-type uncharacterized transport system involved in gliding motility auxiliary subunit